MFKPLALASAAALIIATSGAHAMNVSSNGSRPTVVGPPANFTGTVLATPLALPNDQTNAGATQVEFAPGARSVWHTHPAGQTLIVTSGTGWIQEEGGPRVTVRPGDVITTAPGVKHWHGATSTNAMGHMAITPMRDGKNVTWMEPVSDAQYRAETSAPISAPSPAK